MVALAKDDSGNRLTRTRGTDGYVTAYEWDHRNRLVSVTELDDSETVLASTTHDYDAFNQWIRRTVDADGPGENDATATLFAHHDGQIVYQFAGDEPTDLTNRYLWNPATIDHLLVDEVVADLSTAGDLQFPLGDHLGTLRDIAEYDSATDTTTIANHLRYSSFGAVVSETNSAIDLLFGFTSRPIDESTGLQNNLNRWYDNVLGQWVSEDPIGFDAGDANVRRYVGNRAIMLTDPNGLIGDGHHIVPQELWEFLSEAAKAVFDRDAFRISAPNYKIHNWRSQGGISHCDYNSAVKSELEQFMGRNRIAPGEMTAEEAERFARRILTSRNAVIHTFNQAVRVEMMSAASVYESVLKKGLRNGLSKEAAEKAAIAAAKVAGKRAVEKFWKGLSGQVLEKIGHLLPSASLWRRAKWFCSIGGGAAVLTLLDTGDVSAAAKAAVLDATALDLPIEAGKLLALGFDEVQRQVDETADEYRDDPKWDFGQPGRRRLY